LPINSFLKKQREGAKSAGGPGSGNAKRKSLSRGTTGGGLCARRIRQYTMERLYPSIEV
jgi:hypothetical protein